MKELSDADLISTITGQKDLSKVQKLFYCDGGEMKLRPITNLTMEEIVEYTSMSKTQANRIAASIELGKRISTEPIKKRAHIETPEDIANLFMEDLRYEKQETFHVLLLNTKNEIISKQMISKGNINSSIVDPRDVFSVALKQNAACMVLIHNHPSGNPEPSDADKKVTERLKKAGELLDVKVIDHIIIGDQTFKSLKRERVFEDAERYDSSINEKNRFDRDER